MHTVLRRGIHLGEDRLPPGTRLVAGILLMGGGVLGFLPVLGFWMLPLGAMIAALDIPPLRRRLLARYPRAQGDAAGGAKKDRRA